jgi:hypothetical protein
MKVYIGPYIDFLGPYQIAEKILFWLDKHEDKRVHKFGEWLADKTPLSKICEWIHAKKKRNIKVKIHKYDTWSLDSTISIVILPMLKQLYLTKHGAGLVDDKDVPEGLGLRSTECQEKKNEWDTDDNFFKRYDWIMEEMIWAFEQMQPDCDWEAQYHSGKSDIEWVVTEYDDKGEPKLYKMDRGVNDTHKFDSEGYMKHSDRIDNGLRLFGKYFRTLWD